MKQIGSSEEHGAVYHFGAYPQWATPCAPILFYMHIYLIYTNVPHIIIMILIVLH